MLKIMKDMIKKRSYDYSDAALHGKHETYHIKKQPDEYWIKKFRNRGFKLDSKLVYKIKNHLEKKEK